MRRCPLPDTLQSSNAVAPEVNELLDQVGSTLQPSIRAHLQFESVLAELSATFVNLPAPRVDSQINVALEHLVEFLDVDRCGLAEVPASQDQLIVTHSHHRTGTPLLPGISLEEQLPWYAGIILRGEVFRATRLPDELPPEAVAERRYCTEHGLKSHLMIPLKVMDAVVGAIGFGSFHEYRNWPDALVQQLRLVGEMFTNALFRKRADEMLQAREASLRQTREELSGLAAQLLTAQEEERRHVAREMHDDWSQRLAVLGIDLARLEKHLGAPEAALPLLRTMQQQLVTLGQDVHALSRQLHPSVLEDLGFVDALASECAAFTNREGITVEYRAAAIPSTLNREAALSLYRIAQESLRNVAKHARVKTVSVVVGASAGEVTLCIEDSGVGFDAPGLRGRKGLGLSSMRERGRLIRAEVEVTSSPGRGTKVFIRVPCPGERA